MAIGTRRGHRTGIAVALTLGALTGYVPVHAEPDPPATVTAAPIEIDWRTLARLNYRTGEMPEELKKLDGQIVRMPGFVVPLEDYVESASEFLLVPYYGACVHVPPPPPNQMVYVEMEEQREAQFGWWEPIWLEGRLHINTVDSPYGVVGFHIDGVKVEPYER